MSSEELKMSKEFNRCIEIYKQKLKEKESELKDEYPHEYDEYNNLYMEYFPEAEKKDSNQNKKDVKELK